MSHSTELKFRLGLNELILVSGSASLAEYFGITEIARPVKFNAQETFALIEAQGLRNQLNRIDFRYIEDSMERIVAYYFDGNENDPELNTYIGLTVTRFD